MMRYKINLHGFSLVEVLFAMAIAAFVLTPLFVTQGSLLKNVAKQSGLLDRVFLAKQFLVDCMFTMDKNPRQKDQKPIEKKIEDPATDLKYSVRLIPEKSLLAPFKDVYMHEVVADWKLNGRMTHMNLISFSFNPPEKESQKEPQKGSQKEQPEKAEKK